MSFADLCDFGADRLPAPPPGTPTLPTAAQSIQTVNSPEFWRDVAETMEADLKVGLPGPQPPPSEVAPVREAGVVGWLTQPGVLAGAALTAALLWLLFRPGPPRTPPGPEMGLEGGW